MGNSELAKRARELVERKRKIITAGIDLLVKTGGNYSEEDRKTANGLAEESQRIFREREALLKQAWDELDTGVITILEVEYMDAIREEAEKVRQKLEGILFSA